MRSALPVRHPLAMTLSTGMRGLRLLILAALWLLTTPSPGSTAASDCLMDGAAWIAGLDSPKGEILLRHAATRCDSVGRWLEQNQHPVGSDSYRELCTSLVLVWTHKECVYFRDDLDYRAFNPCQTWMRRMFKRCMAGERDWFLPTGGLDDQPPAKPSQPTKR